MKLFIFLIDLDYYPEENIEQVVLAKDYPQAISILLKEENFDIKDQDSKRDNQWIEEAVTLQLEIDLNDLSSYVRTERLSSIDIKKLNILK